MSPVISLACALRALWICAWFVFKMHNCTMRGLNTRAWTPPYNVDIYYISSLLNLESWVGFTPKCIESNITEQNKTEQNFYFAKYIHCWESKRCSFFTYLGYLARFSNNILSTDLSSVLKLNMLGLTQKTWLRDRLECLTDGHNPYL